jgi:DNA polymerase
MDNVKIAIVGEAYGEEEARFGRPFIGKAGTQLDELLADAGIRRSETYITNVFNLRPDKNDLSTLCCKRTEGDTLSGWPSLVRGLYLRREYKTEIDRLFEDLSTVRPNVVVLLGNTACWAVLQRSAISKIRGACTSSPLLPGLKFLPTYHPANILRQYENRHVAVLDLIKAKRESEFPEIRRPLREIWMEPSLLDMEKFLEDYITPATTMAFDIETEKLQITCIGFAPTSDRAICIPFVDPRKPGRSYWPTLEEELAAWDWVQRALATPCKKLGQNGLYDVQYLWKQYGITVTNYEEDTMLLHHCLQPEAPKSLAFQGTIYTNEQAWKPNRPKGKNEVKREDSE